MAREKILKAENLYCVKCGRQYPLDVCHYECGHCGWPLEVGYSPIDVPAVQMREIREVVENAHGLWDYYGLLPMNDPQSVVSLGEGNTPLRPMSRGAPMNSDFSVFIKNEGLNPTGSFKDRPLSVIVSTAKQHGVQVLITASSGNAGVALAAYAAAAGIDSIVLTPVTVPQEKLIAIKSYGAEVIKVEGAASEALTLVNQITLEKGWFNANTSFRNPYGVEGDKTVAYEIARDLGFESPSYVLVPISAGPLLVGCYKGFHDLVEWGMLGSMPRLVGIQAEGCAPIAKAFEQGKESVEPWGEPETVAWGIADPLRGYEKDGTLTLETVRKTNGLVLTVPDDEIIAAMKMLATHEGVFAEPTGAVSIAGVQKLARSGQFHSGDKVVCIVTGAGFKDIGTIQQYVRMDDIQTIRPDPREMLRIYGDLS